MPTRTTKRPAPEGLTTTLRLPPDLARVTRVAAASRGQSLHAWVLAAIRGAVLHQARDGDTSVRAALDGR